MPNNYKKFSKGFGILEVLISSAIIIVVLGTLVFIAQSSLANAAYMQERAQAISLAAEAIETVRQNRDSNYIDVNSSTKWNTVGINSDKDLFSYTTYNYDIPVALNTANHRLYLTAFSRSSIPSAVKIDGVSFSRKINLTSISGTSLLTGVAALDSNGSGNGFFATVTVTWKGSGGKDGSAQVRELITNSRFVY